MNARMGRDRNGNKVVKLTFPGERGFSIQTNGNLPITDRTNTPNSDEISAYVREHGTFRQQMLWFG